LDFVPAGLDFVPPDFDFVPTGFDFLPTYFELLPPAFEVGRGCGMDPLSAANPSERWQARAYQPKQAASARADAAGKPGEASPTRESCDRSRSGK